MAKGWSLMLAVVATLLTLEATPAWGQPDTIAIVGAAVIPMDRNLALPDHTVLVSGDRIIAVGPRSAIRVPPRARIIDGRGRWLMPGLADMHVHLNARVGAKPEFGDGPLFLAAGVTTVLDLKGDSITLDWRERVKAGRLIGPTIYTSGDFVNEPRVNTPEEAEKEIRAQAAAGYDIIKIREVVDPVRRAILTTKGMTLETYLRAMETARASGLPVIGHVPANLGNQAAIDAGQSWAHMYTIMPVARLGDSALSRIGADMARAGIWVTPTLVVYRADALANSPEAALVSEAARAWWVPFARNAPPDRVQWAVVMLDTLQHAVKLLHQAGVSLLAGTDALGWPFMIPGSGLHEEFRLLSAAGLSPYEVLRTSTVEAARFLDQSNEFGTIAVGRRADLILTAGNPLEDLESLRHPLAVMSRGQWMDSAELERLVARLRTP